MDLTAAGTVTQPLGMSNSERNEMYVSHKNGQGVVLPYDDGRLGLLLMLPNEGVSLTDYLVGWDGSTVRELLDGQDERLTYLTVPKFETEWGGSLADILCSMNLTGASDPGAADFTDMGITASGNPLFIGDVIHKTAFKLNEKGTEAAAVTMVAMDPGAAMPSNDRIVLRYDRPFAYGIVDMETEALLFPGTAERLE